MRIKSVTALMVAAGLLASLGTALAANPTQADFDACNKEAQSRQSSPAASPSTSGPSTPGTGGGATGSVSGGTTGAGSSVSGGASTSSDADVALRGIDASGKGDPSFQAAYRECMKRRGF
jgi:hypothetical protein